MMNFNDIYPAYKKFLIFAPHQDDEVLGCGGLLFKINNMHDTTIKIIYVTDGKNGYNENNTDISKTRYNETKALMSYMKISNYSFFNLPDGNVQKHSDVLLDLMVEQINSFMPDIVMAPHIDEQHPDHLAVAKVILNIQLILPDINYISYEVWEKIANPNFYYILTPNEFYIKCRMLKYYSSQKNVFGQISNAGVRGKEINSKYAEAYIINERR